MSKSSRALCWLELPDGNSIQILDHCSIGRSLENAIVVDSDYASRRHAVLLPREHGQFWLVNFSRNGTLINNRTTFQPKPLRNGDEIGIPHAPARYIFRSGSAPAKTRRATSAATLRAPLRITPAWIMIGDLEKFGVLCRLHPPDHVASMISEWLKGCTEAVEKNGGEVNNYTGDGFLAWWLGAEEAARGVAAAVQSLRALRGRLASPFRVIVHAGQIGIGGVDTFGESMTGAAVVQAFRMEKVAAALKLDFCFSKEARAMLQKLLPLAAVPGKHELKSYDDTFKLYSLPTQTTR